MKAASFQEPLSFRTVRSATNAKSGDFRSWCFLLNTAKPPAIRKPTALPSDRTKRGRSGTSSFTWAWQAMSGSDLKSICRSYLRSSGIFVDLELTSPVMRARQATAGTLVASRTGRRELAPTIPWSFLKRQRRRRGQPSRGYPFGIRALPTE